MYRFERVDILNSGFDDKSIDLVIASEVLEHLEDSALYLKKLVELSRQYIFLTVPWEPWFQLMNFLRGRDFFRLGNHPEHVNHWGLKRFRKYVAQFAQVEKAFTVFPFIIVMALTGEV
jgi:predicted SAM-dependent methyltransferase